MAINTKSASVEEQVFDADAYVSDFLRESPGFFARNPELLLDIEVPHQQRGAVSLVERQVMVQREQYTDLQQRLTEIVDVAHQNDHLSELLHDYSVGLMSAGSLDEVFSFTETIMLKRLRCEMSSAVLRRNDVVEACLEGLSDYVELVDDKLCDSMGDLHTRRSVYCGYPITNRVEQFFPGCTGSVKSMAIIRLAYAPSVQPINGAGEYAGGGEYASSVDYRNAASGKVISRSREFGYLAMASSNRERFAPHMGTDFLSRFGSLLSARLAVFYRAA